jgi:ABC-type uncharacterized transport system permease subunit
MKANRFWSWLFLILGIANFVYIWLRSRAERWIK